MKLNDAKRGMRAELDPELYELRALSNRFRQMLVITHLPEIAELCDQQLEVTIDAPGRSTACLA